MTTLETAITDARVTGTSAAEKLVSLKADVDGSGDSTLYTWSGFSQKLLALGVSAGVVLGLPVLIPNLTGGSLFDRCLASGGFDFSDGTNRALMTAAKSGASAEVISLLDAMLSIGANKPLWEVLSLSEEPTEEHVTAAMAKNEVVQWWAQVANELVGPLITAGKSIDEIKTAIAES